MFLDHEGSERGLESIARRGKSDFKKITKESV